MNTVIRGFVVKIEIGRGGLVSVTVLLADGSFGVFVISDLDADPERYNERLSKLAIARDSMNYAEPVEISAVQGKSGQEIDSITRITRNELDTAQSPSVVDGLVLGLGVVSSNTITNDGETHDTAEVRVLTNQLSLVTLHLDMQIPEREVAAQQLEIIRDAFANGDPLRFLVESTNAENSSAQNGQIYGVVSGLDSGVVSGRQSNILDGFVESLGLIRLPPGVSGASNLAYARFTTAPTFTGAGNIVGLSPFTPVTLNLAVPKDSQTYALLEAGLRDNLRMRISVMDFKTQGRDVATNMPAGNMSLASTANQPANAGNTAPMASLDGLRVRMFGDLMTSDTSTAGGQSAVFVLAAELLAPLASASRPVWITISRELLDRGSEVACTTGVPSSDLTVLTLRDLRLPYPAAWEGFGCFNDGVYRFQFQLRTAFKVCVDGRELCLYDSDKDGIKMAYACLGGDHRVSVILEAWTCDDEFIMDVYRLR